MKFIPIFIFSLANSFFGQGILSSTFFVSLTIFFCGYMCYRVINVYRNSEKFTLPVVILILFAFISSSAFCASLLVTYSDSLTYIYLAGIDLISGFYAGYTRNYEEEFDEDDEECEENFEESDENESNNASNDENSNDQGN